MLDGIFQKKFGLKEARIVNEEVNTPADENGDSVSVRTMKAIFKVMNIKNTVLADIAKENGGRKMQITALDEDVVKTTEEDAAAKEQHRIAMENLRKIEEERQTMVAERLKDNTTSKQELQEEITETNTLSIWG